MASGVRHAAVRRQPTRRGLLSRFRSDVPHGCLVFTMAILIGADEAGYGPNLGPLIISATRWHVPGAVEEVDLYRRLSHSVHRLPERDGHKPSIVDSKLLYKARGSLDRLEEGVHAALRAARRTSLTWRGAWRELAPAALVDVDALPWHDGYDPPVPVACGEEQLSQVAHRFQQGLTREEVKLTALQSNALFPRTFNREVRRCGNKSTVLTEGTLRLLIDLLPCPAERDEPVFIVCDKHGGRNFYAAALQHAFPDELIQVVRESAAESVYRWGTQDRPVQIRFQAKGENHLPSALASMVSKYLRELAMLPFNQYWTERSPQLKPTAGYPQDAKRFLRDIAKDLAKLKLDQDDYWRCK